MRGVVPQATRRHRDCIAAGRHPERVNALAPTTLESIGPLLNADGPFDATCAIAQTSMARVPKVRTPTIILIVLFALFALLVH